MRGKQLLYDKLKWGEMLQGHQATRPGDITDCVIMREGATGRMAKNQPSEVS